MARQLDRLFDYLLREKIDFRVHDDGRHVEVLGNLTLDKRTDVELSEMLTVMGTLKISRPPFVVLPDTLVVTGSLTLESATITALPETLSVGVDLMLRDTSITTLPLGLRVRGNMDMKNSPIGQLPKGLVVDGDLMLWDTPITAFPRDMVVGGMIYPPPGLQDAREFLKTHAMPTGLNICLSPPTQHERLELRGRLAPFPDLLRVFERVPPGFALHLVMTIEGSLAPFILPDL